MKFKDSYNQGDIVEVFTEPKNQYSKIEGKFELLKFLEYGNTYYLDYEKLENQEKINSSSLTRKDKSKERFNKLYKLLDLYFNSTNPIVQDLSRNLKKKTKPTYKSYADMHQYLSLFRKQHSNINDTHFINNILSIDNEYIVRYFHQKYIRDWKPTLYRLERWTVKLVPESSFDIAYVCNRWIPTIYSICANEKSYLIDE